MTTSISPIATVAATPTAIRQYVNAELATLAEAAATGRRGLLDATGPQLDYIVGLLDRRNVPDSWLYRIATILETHALTKVKAGAVITSLKALDIKPQPRVPAAESALPPVYVTGLPTGVTYYALGTKTDPRRYRISRPTKGRWAGRTFVDFIDTVDGRQAIRDRQQRDTVLAAIVADMEAAGRLYAQVTGRCWKCDIALTDPASVLMSIGPDCWKHIHGRTRKVADVEEFRRAHPELLDDEQADASAGSVPAPKELPTADPDAENCYMCGGGWRRGNPLLSGLYGPCHAGCAAGEQPGLRTA